MARTVLVTGAAGFIGAALSQRLLQQGDRVVGLDNLNDYYDPSLKQARLRRIEAIASEDAWRFAEMALEDGDALMALFAAEKPTVVVNLAAQAGVRYSLENPAAYIQSNLVGFGHICLRGAATTGWNTWCMPPVARCMAATATCPFDEQPTGESPGEPLCRQQEGQRIDGSHL